MSERLFEGRVAALAGQALGMASALRPPKAALAVAVNAYVAWFGVDLGEALVPPGGFSSFADFFARKLKPDARPVCGDPHVLVSPCDGVVTDRGRFDGGKASTFTVKGAVYRLEELIADTERAAGLSGGGYCVIYLHPRDYHRVHVPLDAALREVRHVPGARYPVAAWAEGMSEAIMGKNERVAFDLEPPGGDRRFVLLMVAAFGVSDIECRHAPSNEEARKGVRRIACSASLTRGDEIGAFRLGSTVALFWPRDAVELDDSVVTGARVLTGQRIGRVRASMDTASPS